MKQTWSMVDAYPPPLVRCLARRKVVGKHVQVLSDQEIAIESNLPIERVIEIYNSLTWDRIPVGDMRAFCGACGFDPCDGQDRNRVNAYVGQKGGPKWAFLRSSPYWNTVFRPLLIKMMEASDAAS